MSNVSAAVLPAVPELDLSDAQDRIILAAYLVRMWIRQLIPEDVVGETMELPLIRLLSGLRVVCIR
jgi:hypothetical protein